MEKPIEHDSHRAIFRCFSVGGFDLPEDLGLSDDHGIEAGGHTKKMADGIHVPVEVEVRVQMDGVGVPQVVRNQSLDFLERPVQRVAREQDLDPVAGRKHKHFLNVLQVGELLQGVRLTSAYQSELLSYFYRSRFVIHSQKSNMTHRNLDLYRTRAAWCPFMNRFTPRNVTRMAEKPKMASHAARRPRQPTARRSCNSTA